MSSTSARAARRERQAAAVLGSERVHRQRGERAPDVEPVRLPSGHLLQAEVKSRAKLPRIARLAVEQAHGYAPGAMPVAVIFEKGSRDGIASMRLADFARLVGLDVDELPDARPLRRPRRVKDHQLTLFEVIR
jgi:hypothetical protein